MGMDEAAVRPRPRLISNCNEAGIYTSLFIQQLRGRGYSLTTKLGVGVYHLSIEREPLPVGAHGHVDEHFRRG